METLAYSLTRDLRPAYVIPDNWEGVTSMSHRYDQETGQDYNIGPWMMLLTIGILGLIALIGSLCWRYVAPAVEPSDASASQETQQSATPPDR